MGALRGVVSGSLGVHVGLAEIACGLQSMRACQAKRKPLAAHHAALG